VVSRSPLLGVVLALVTAGGALAQPAASNGAAPSVDAKPFLQAMIRLKQAADTCDPYVANGPAQRVAGIDSFFASLHQPLPASMVDEKTSASLGRFIKPQAASICKVMLDKDFESYEKQAALYEAKKPEQWPDAPKLEPAPWCATPNCLDIE
jgi:hypothetical protein